MTLNILHLDLVGLLMLMILALILLLHTHFHLLSLGHFGMITTVLTDGVHTDAPLHIRTHFAFGRLESLHFPVVFLVAILRVNFLLHFNFMLLHHLEIFAVVVFGELLARLGSQNATHGRAVVVCCASHLFSLSLYQSILS